MTLRQTIAAAAAAGALVGTGLVVLPLGEDNPSPAAQACRGGLCQATRVVSDPTQCDALVRCDGCDDSLITFAGADPCAPGAETPAGNRAARQLYCLRRAGLIDTWHAYWAEGGDDPGASGCLYDLLLTQEQADAWDDAIDRVSSTLPPVSALADLPAAAKRGGLRRHGWAGVEVDP